MELLSISAPPFQIPAPSPPFPPSAAVLANNGRETARATRAGCVLADRAIVQRQVAGVADSCAAAAVSAGSLACRAHTTGVEAAPTAPNRGVFAHNAAVERQPACIVDARPVAAGPADKAAGSCGRIVASNGAAPEPELTGVEDSTAAFAAGGCAATDGDLSKYQLRAGQNVEDPVARTGSVNDHLCGRHANDGQPPPSDVQIAGVGRCLARSGDGSTGKCLWRAGWYCFRPGCSRR